MAVIRYPGSKAKLADEIIDRFPDRMKCALWTTAHKWEYREPFFGAGAVGFRVMRHLNDSARVWINDLDYGMVCLWKAIKDDLASLQKRIMFFRPTVDKFEEFKALDGDRGGDPMMVGFRKLALHQMSYSGLGVKSGGPLGGRHQKNLKYRVDCRWNVGSLFKNIKAVHRQLARLRNLKMSCKDFAQLIDGDDSGFLYLDPPYYEQGPALYKHSFGDDDHRRLAAALRATRCPWVLSYDDHPVIRELYAWARIEALEIVYTTARAKSKRPKNREVLILPDLAEGTMKN